MNAEKELIAIGIYISMAGIGGALLGGVGIVMGCFTALLIVKGMGL